MKAMHAAKRPKPESAAKPAQKGIRGRGLTVAALALTLGTAVYLNWSFARQAPLLTADAAAGTAADAVTVAAGTAEGEDAVVVYDPLEGGAAAGESAVEQSANKNYGEAQLVSVNQDSGTEFFEQTRLARAKARDEALEALEDALKKSGLSEAEKNGLTAQLSAQLSSVTKESDLETLIKAKGFADCVVVLGDDTANVTVMTENDALTADEVTRIRDVVLSRCADLDAQGITVVEVK